MRSRRTFKSHVAHVYSGLRTKEIDKSFLDPIFMEALVAVGFAANVLQFVDYICHTLKIGKQVWSNGMSDTGSDLECSTTLLEHQIERIRRQSGTASGVNEASQVTCALIIL